MQFSVHINPLPRPDRAKLPLQLFSITENIAGGRRRGSIETAHYGSNSYIPLHIGSFIPWQLATLFALRIWLGSLVPVQKLGPARQARKICAVVHGPVYARDHLTINEIKNSITLELQADTEAEAGPVPVPVPGPCPKLQ